jgi:subtilase family serine protease
VALSKYKSAAGLALLGACSCLALTSTTAAIATSAESKDNSGWVAPWVAGAERLGPADESKNVLISVYLDFKDMKGLEQLIEAQVTRGDPEYGRFLTPAEFHARFSPDRANVDLVKDTLHRLGFTIVRSPDSGLYVEAVGTVGQIKAAFHVSQDNYRLKDKTLRANAEAPTIPAQIAGLVTAIRGLDDSALLVHPYHVGIDRASVAQVVQSADAPVQPPTPDFLPSPYCSTYWADHKATVSPAPTPYAAVEPWLNCGYTPQQLQQGYGADKVSEDGKGVTVAIVDAYASPTIVHDANAYARNHGLPLPNITQLLPAGVLDVAADGAECGQQGWFLEESLDFSAVHSMAPGAKIVYSAASTCQNVGTTAEPVTLQDALYVVVEDRLADIITNSYGDNGEGQPATAEAADNKQFMQAAAEGISILFSTGDDGDLSQVNGVTSGSWPATSPYVTAVGGTTLALKDKAGTKAEWGWGTYRSYLGTGSSSYTINSTGTAVTWDGTAGLDFIFYSGSGGGPSLTQPEPAQQVGIVPAGLASFVYSATGETIPLDGKKRVTPDVAMDADPYSGFLYGETYTIATAANTGVPAAEAEIFNSPCKAYTKTLEYCEYAEGGTSLASPSFAGVLARVVQKKGSGLGLVTKQLYKLTIGAPGSTTTPLVDVRAPTAPTSVLRGYPALLGEDPRLVTVNSVAAPGPGWFSCPTNGVCEGLDDVFLETTKGYDAVTGIGTPYVPVLVETLGAR